MRREMRLKLVFPIVLGLASAALAKDPKPLQTGTLVQMETVPCSVAERDAVSVAIEVAATDAANKTQEVRCHEYLLQAERIIYRIRPSDAKHAELLPVGETAQFRLEKDEMLLQVEDLDNPYRDSPDRSGKERAFIVVSMTPRSDSTAAAAPVRLNHLQ
jgi:hypothetical protein